MRWWRFACVGPAEARVHPLARALRQAVQDDGEDDDRDAGLECLADVDL